MAFVRHKTFYSKRGHPRTYYYLVESVREGGQVRQHHIRYVGKTPEMQE